MAEFGGFGPGKGFLRRFGRLWIKNRPKICLGGDFLGQNKINKFSSFGLHQQNKANSIGELSFSKFSNIIVMSIGMKSMLALKTKLLQYLMKRYFSHQFH